MKLLDETLFRVLAREPERRVSQFNAQDLANTAWTFARPNLLNEKLFRALAREAERQVGRRQRAAQTDTSLGAARAYATWTRLEREFALGASRGRRLLLPRHSRERFIEMVEWMGHDEGRRVLLPQVQRAVGLHTAQTGLTDWSADEGVRRRLDALRRGEEATEG